MLFFILFTDFSRDCWAKLQFSTYLVCFSRILTLVVRSRTDLSTCFKVFLVSNTACSIWSSSCILIFISLTCRTNTWAALIPVPRAVQYSLSDSLWAGMQVMRQWESQGAMVGERGHVAYLDFEGCFPISRSRTASLGYPVGYSGLALGNLLIVYLLHLLLEYEGLKYRHYCILYRDLVSDRLIFLGITQCLCPWNSYLTFCVYCVVLCSNRFPFIKCVNVSK